MSLLMGHRGCNPLYWRLVGPMEWEWLTAESLLLGGNKVDLLSASLMEKHSTYTSYNRVCGV
jgi:hypothetical protein